LKRIYLHIGFWLVYLLQDVTFIYLWDKEVLPGVPVGHQLFFAIANCSVSLIPKMFFAYYLIYNNLPKLLNSRNERHKNIIYLIAVLIATVFLYRALYVFFIYPAIYKGFLPVPPFFKPVNFFSLLMDLGFASGAAVFIKQIRLQLTNKEREKNLIKDKLETELKFLRNQTNPHFLFNTLNNIYALAIKKSDDTADVVMKLSKLLRFMLYESKNMQIRMSEEIKVLDDFIELEKIRYNERLTISFLREIDNENEQIAPLLLIPFVENAFKHGASESRFESLIHLDMKLQNGVLEFYIENTKELSDKKPNNENIGLANVRRQLELLYKEHEVTIQNEPTIFKVFLQINLNSYANI
jgi:two-component system, LytTR family, sensor kinase